ncbi:CMF_HP2_G0037360.mRNA.1.CDS.1 [Saccharomyces cerevisiae]|nr:CMF_HP2_G0037360.mRNA.1.CDS.1 [Saccharomyces cerevisiae]CAI6661347.1 CMF_HP2_G0037360.mRNA.1.CDS.1 [Saccharomyces cerevisiae]CAI6701887.1 CMF_HP1_G0041710.mRNA.1.CDS.1 [Saccharomyces cerevisiae]CAI7433458.1 CMF_collapsed_G0042970.mRNA.1.CDS.1 [Saccharomyces cerevisiae]
MTNMAEDKTSISKVHSEFSNSSNTTGSEEESRSHQESFDGESSSGESKSKSKLNLEYSADIEPLKFRMTKTNNTNDKLKYSNNGNATDSFMRLKEHLQRGNTLNSNLRVNEFYPFNSIDTEQFENYLREPKYIKMLKRRKNLKQFRRLFLAQELMAYEGETVTSTSKSSEPTSKAIWSTKFSRDGKFMATGSKDGKIRIWKVIGSPVERAELDSSAESNKEARAKSMRIKQQVSSLNNPKEKQFLDSATEKYEEKEKLLNLYAPVFHPTPLRLYKEHVQDVLDINWSKNNFILSASMDKTVKLWHPDRKNSLKTFIHPDFVTCVEFHPTDDRFFISGCLDHKCRLWSILDDEVSFEYDCQDLITSVTLSPEEGKYTIIGTFNGYVHILMTRGLTPVSSFHVADRQTQEQNAHVMVTETDSKIRHGPRVTGLQAFRSQLDNSFRLVVTSNDSRIRIFDLEQRKLLEVLKGFHSGSSQHKAQLSIWHGQPIVVNSSDDHWVYGWRLKSSDRENDQDEPKRKPKRLARSGSLRSIFSKSMSRSSSQNNEEKPHHHLKLTNLLPLPHHSNDHYIKNTDYISFHAHNAPVTCVSIAPPETSKTLSLSNDVICELSLEFFQTSDSFDVLSRSNDDGIMSDVESSLGYNSKPGSISNASATSAIPDVVDAIGTILISTDNVGTIRVFRADMPSVIRKRVLLKLEEYNREVRRRFNSSDSLHSLSRSFNSRAKSNLAGQPAAAYTNTGKGYATGRGYSNICPKSSTSLKTLGSNAQPRTPRESMSSIFSNAHGPTTPTSAMNLPIRCNVCNGSRFEAFSGPNDQQDRNYYCVDCGTVVNNFR